MTVHFINVGRDKKNWDADIPTLSDREIRREIRSNTTLMSRDIQIAWDEEGTSAAIFVGLFRRVGEIRVSGGMKLKVA